MRPLLFVVVLSFLVTSCAYAAEISNVRVTDITEGGATIRWTTDAETDSTVNFGLDARVGVVRDPSFSKKEHELVVDDLDSSTLYHFRVISTDSAGNRSATGGFTFVTRSSLSTPQTQAIKDPEQRAKTEKILEDLEEITDPQAVLAINEKVRNVAADILRPPAIRGLPKVTVREDGAIIRWTTDREANSLVSLASDAEFLSGAGAYTITQGNPNEYVTSHEVDVIGLEPSTIYHFKLASADSVGLTGETEDDTFVTRSLLPDIQGVRVSRIQETSAVVSWNTASVLAKGVVEYTNLRTNITRSTGDPVFAATHNVQLTGLEFGTRYSVTISATNEAGEEVVSSPFTFVTVRDVIAPAISKVKNESTLFPGEETKIQTILAWETDEPATCQVSYIQGLIKDESGTGESLPAETNPVTNHTQVVVGFAPATVYKFWMKCRDEAQNESQSEDFVLITPIKEKSIIDIILENFEGTFGWVKNITN